MRSKLLNDHAGERTFAVILETGDEVMGCLKQFAQQENLSAAQLTALGAFSDAVLNYFDWETKWTTSTYRFANKSRSRH